MNTGFKKNVYSISVVTLFFINTTVWAISGGTIAYQSDWPSIITIQSKSLDKHVCAATLIAPSVAMTAAHCVLDQNTNDMELYIGAFDAVNPLSERFDVSATLVHPEYSTSGPKNDIALIYLIGESTHPTITLSTSPNPSLNYISAGWGENGYGMLNRFLHEVDLKHANGCNASFPFNSNIHICAGGQGGKSTCPGDSGGPLVINTGSGYVQTGIVSTGTSTGHLECGVEGSFGVFTKVSAFRDWVLQNLNPPVVEPPVVEPPVVEPPVDESTPSGAACSWSDTPFYGNGNQYGSIYMYAPLKACTNSVKEIETANGVITTSYR